MAFVSDNWDWLIGITAATASLTLARAEVLKPTDHAAFHKPLREMLVRFLAGITLVMLFVLLIYVEGLVVPAIAAIVLGTASWFALHRLRLARFYDYQLILAFIAFFFGLASWLTPF